MADIETKRISELIAAQDIGDSDLFVIEQGGAAKKALGSVVKGAIGGSSLPPGGTPGQVLTKTATGEAWDDVSGLPDGGSNGQVLTKTANGAAWSDAGTPTQAQTDSAVADWLDEHPEATTTVQDGSITEQKLDPLLTAKVNGGGISNAVKVALLALLEKVAYIDEDGQTYLDALEDALYPPTNLVSISAVFNQGSAVIYDTDSLDTLKQYLTVTANYSDSTTETVTSYTLSGTLAAGTSTITVSYGGKTTTFAVTVTANPVITGYTSVGTPTIADNIFTPSANGYIKTPQAFSPGDASWKLVIKVKTSNLTGVFQNMFRATDAEDAARKALLCQNTNTAGQHNFYMSSDNSNYDIMNNKFFLVPTSTDLFFEVAYNGSDTYTVKTSSDGETWTTNVTVTSNKKVYSGSQIAFGGPNSTTTPYGGLIYLDCLKIYIDGELWWQAVAS